MLRHWAKGLLVLASSAALAAPAMAVTGDGSAQVTDSTPGADYVGSISTGGDTLSGVYLGSGYVLTAAHVGPGAFTLDGVTYQPVANSAVEIGSADLTLFQISNYPTLPPLSLAANASPDGTEFYLIGFGGGQGETYGQDVITTSYEKITQISPYTSIDFQELSGTYPQYGDFTNSAVLISGDSGGGDFTDVNGNLVLIGINEALETDGVGGPTVGSDFVRISNYSSIITADMAPEPPALLLVMAGMGMIVLVPRARRALARVAGR